MSNDRRGIVEGKLYQGIEEEITYALTVTNVGSSPTDVTVKAYLYSETDGSLSDVTSTVMPAGSPSVVGNVITLPELLSLTIDRLYRVEVKYTVSGNIVESWFEVQSGR